MKQTKSYRCCGGTLGIWEHDSKVLQGSTTFSVFLPPQAEKGPVPFVTFLSGLTCTHENFTTKAGAYQTAAALGLAVVAPDTSPRGENVPNDDAYDLGQGAGFYINATQEPWSQHFHMERYVMEELLPLVEASFPVDAQRRGITGHSMGGHGALTLFFKYPGAFASVSAFAPIVAPTQVPWGHKAFTAYLGDDRNEWKKHDACELVRQGEDASNNPKILIDQGTADGFLEEQLQPELFQDACASVGQSLTLRMQEGYDHSYYFIQSFVAEHLAHHKAYLEK